MSQLTMRRAGAFAAGVLTAGIVIALVESAAHNWITGNAVFVAACGAQFLGAAAGGGLAVRLGDKQPGNTALAWAIAAVLLLLTLLNVFSFAHPVWFVPAVLIALAAGARLGIALAGR